MDELLTLQEVARLVKVHPHSVRRWIKRRLLTGIKVREQWRVRRADLEAFLKIVSAQPDEQANAA
jgi:excisionase family DNA binding protein